MVTKIWNKWRKEFQSWWLFIEKFLLLVLTCFNLQDATESSSFTSNMQSTAKAGFPGKAHHLELYSKEKSGTGSSEQRGNRESIISIVSTMHALCDCTSSPFSATCHPLKRFPQIRPVSKVQQVSALRTYHCIQSIRKGAITTSYNIKNTHLYIGQQYKESRTRVVYVTAKCFGHMLKYWANTYLF